MSNFLENLATATKAVIATTIIGMPALYTALMALVAYLGVGEMPSSVDVQVAIVNLLIAFVGGLAVYQMPNATKEQVAAQKVEDKKAEDVIEAVKEDDVKVNTLEENPPV